jgi:hypothetical protein
MAAVRSIRSIDRLDSIGIWHGTRGSRDDGHFLLYDVTSWMRNVVVVVAQIIREQGLAPRLVACRHCTLKLGVVREPCREHVRQSP